MAGLAARCTACGTAFRVVPDQLRVAGGYVRCGRCSAVFNAAESLIDLDSLAPIAPAVAPAWQQTVAPPTETAAAAEALEAAASEPAADLAAWPLPSAPDPALDSASFEPLAGPAPAAVPQPEPDLSPVPEAAPDRHPEPALAEALAPASFEPAAVPDLADRPAFNEAEADAAQAEARAAADAQPEAGQPASGTDFDLKFAEPPPADEPEAPPQELSADAAEAFELDLPHPDPGSKPEAPRADPAFEPYETAQALAAETATPFETTRSLDTNDSDDSRPPRIDYDPHAAAKPVSIELTLPPPSPDAPPQQLSLQTAPAEEALSLRAEPGDQPSFVRSAERSQRWNAPPVRRRVAAGVAVGLLLLAGQAVFNWRDDIVARWPGTRPVIEPPCLAFGCRIEAPRALEALAIESSGLVRVEKSAVYKLQLALRNRSAQDVALPALELTLSDAQGKPLARRVMRAADFGVNAATLPAGREVAMQATLQAQFPGDAPVAGYTIDPFYP